MPPADDRHPTELCRQIDLTETAVGGLVDDHQSRDELRCLFSQSDANDTTHRVPNYRRARDATAPHGLCHELSLLLHPVALCGLL